VRKGKEILTISYKNGNIKEIIQELNNRGYTNSFSYNPFEVRHIYRNINKERKLKNLFCMYGADKMYRDRNNNIYRFYIYYD